MSSPKRHIGRLINTDRRCVVVFMQIPGDKDHALVIDTDGIPDFVHESLFKIVDSRDAQQEINLSDILNRRISPEPSVDMLTYLHTRGLLNRTQVTNVMMYPFPNQPVPLDQLLSMIGEMPTKMADKGSDEKFNPILENQRVENFEATLGMAKGKIQEAEMLESEAKRKREEAYKMVPQLRPRTSQESYSTQVPTINTNPTTDVDPTLPPDVQEALLRAQEAFQEDPIQEVVEIKDSPTPKKRGRKKAS